MKYLALTLRQPREIRHPMQDFIADGEAVEWVELVSWNVLAEAGVEYLLFYVRGEIDPYREAIAAVDSVPEFSLVPGERESFYAYVVQETRESDRRFRAAFAERRLILIPPIEYTGEGYMRLTVVGEADDLHGLIDGIPDPIGVDVDRVGEYDRRHGTVAADLTERQYEAVRVAVELGYYAVPREASLEAVADELDCAASTASNHLRKAEETVMIGLVTPGSAR